MCDGHTFATPRFSTAGILWPAIRTSISMELASKSSICSFQFERTSEIQLTFLEWVEVRERILDEFCRKPHT